RRRRIEIIETDQQRTLNLLDVDHRSDRRHDAIAGLDRQPADIVDGGAVVVQRLGVDLEDVSELVELGRVVRADIGRQGGKYGTGRDTERLGLDAVDGDPKLRGGGPEGRTQPLQRRL